MLSCVYAAFLAFCDMASTNNLINSGESLLDDPDIVAGVYLTIVLCFIGTIVAVKYHQYQKRRAMAATYYERYYNLQSIQREAMKRQLSHIIGTDDFMPSADDQGCESSAEHSRKRAAHQQPISMSFVHIAIEKHHRSDYCDMV